MNADDIATHDDAPARSTEPGWSRVMVAGLCRGLLALVSSLLVWSLVPALWGWTPQVIVTGSMTPQILVGDVVVTKDLDVASVQPGQVITVTDPDHDGRTRTHRFVRFDDDGNLVTRGDANESDDSTHVAPQDVLGVAVLRIPYVGRLVTWQAQQAWLPLMAVPLTALVLALGARLPAHRARWRTPPRPGGGRRQRGVAAVVVGVTAATMAGGPADAVFTRKQANATSTLSAASTFYPYRQAVLADAPYLFWRLNATTGTVAADTTANARAGTISGAPVYSQADGINDNKETALGLGTGTRITQNASQTTPAAFTVEAWVRTTGTAGGRLVGFGNGGGTTASTTVEAQLYVGTTGQVYFGLGSAKTTVASTVLVNNGAWHHVVGTYAAGTGGAKLYVNGTLRASGTATLQSFTGFWRAGAETLTGWTANPTGQFLTGTIDEVAVYTTALTQTQVSAHYAART